MFVGWYGSEFWRTNLDDVPCTVEEMEEAADGAFVLGFYYRNPVIERGIAGLTGNTFDFFIPISDTTTKFVIMII